MTVRAKMLSLFAKHHDAAPDAPRDPRALWTIAYLKEKNIPAAHNAAVIARLLASRAADRNLVRMAALDPRSSEWMMEFYAALEIVIGEPEVSLEEVASKRSGSMPQPTAKRQTEDRYTGHGAVGTRSWRSFGRTIIRGPWPGRAQR